MKGTSCSTGFVIIILSLISPIETSRPVGEKIHRRKFNNIPGAIFISTREGRCIDQLKALATHVLNGKFQPEETIITNARHYDALQQVELSLKDMRKGLD